MFNVFPCSVTELNAYYYSVYSTFQAHVYRLVLTNVETHLNYKSNMNTKLSNLKTCQYCLILRSM